MIPKDFDLVTRLMITKVMMEKGSERKNDFWKAHYEGLQSSYFRLKGLYWGSYRRKE